MSAIAQYLRISGKTVSGSDRLFQPDHKMEIQLQFEKMDIHCYLQDGTGINKDVDVLVISTAIEDSNIDVRKALDLNIPIVKRSELLASISRTKRTIAVGGTSGKSTTSAMIYHILEETRVSPSLIAGAALTSIQNHGLIGNATVGTSDFLIIEADESDGSIVNYTSEIALLLNMDRDHKDYDELTNLFKIFRQNTTGKFIVNQSNERSAALSVNKLFDFGVDKDCGVVGSNFKQEGFSISFLCNNEKATVPVIGKHNMENALAAIAAGCAMGIPLRYCVKALNSYSGIYRRTQYVGTSKKGVTVIDDFAHNPSEVACAIKACQEVGKRVFAWFQPHGFGPLNFMHKELETEVLNVLRKDDYFLLSDVYYAGGTVTRNVTSFDVYESMKELSDHVNYFPNRSTMIPFLKTSTKKGDVVLIMGARDTTLNDFAHEVMENV